MAPLLEAKGLRKEFPGVVALADGRLALERGQVHALLGENGAGKSTLMKLLSGLYRPDGGALELEGREVQFHSPADAQRAGIAIIYQEFSLVPDLSIAECVYLGAEPTRLGLPDFAAMREGARQLLSGLGLSVDPRTKVRDLSVAEQQMVEIARALRAKARVLAMDEPTAALSHRESERLFETVRKLRAEGVAILYVSHRFQEVFSLCEVATVLRDGSTVGHLKLSGTSEKELVKMMVGREVSELFPGGGRQVGAVRLSVQGLTRSPRFAGIDLEVKAGEIVGLAGLVGAGRTEVLRGIFGADPVDAGEVRVDGAPVPGHSPSSSVEAGLGLLTEDRKQQGLLLERAIRENATLASLPQYSAAGVVNEGAEARGAQAALEKVRVRMAGQEAEVSSLSGGNQQKVLLARWLLRGCKVLMFDEPTRGIDVGARAEIYEQIHQLARQGLAILVVSSDLPEVIGLCDRVLVMADGRIQGQLSRAEATEERILGLATPRGVARV